MFARVSAVLAAIALAGCATMSSEPKTVLDAAAGDPKYSTLTKLINDAGLADTLRGAGPFTVFAPTDEAFKKVPAKTLSEIAGDKERLRAVLTYHVIPGKVMAKDVKSGDVKTVQGAAVPVAKAGTFVTVDTAVVTQADIVAGNGVVHGIDTVLIPPAPRR
jgi:uncharacterized surface protein with fasciclin (FAS1) repeats